MPIANSHPDQQPADELYLQIQQSHAKLVGADGTQQALPASLSDFLVKLTADLRKGQSVAIVQNDAQVTTVEGARMLGVSRQFLIKLIEAGAIPHYMVGTHRRIYVRDLLAYKTKRDAHRRRTLDDLARAEAADGLYDLDRPRSSTWRKCDRPGGLSRG